MQICQIYNHLGFKGRCPGNLISSNPISSNPISSYLMRVIKSTCLEYDRKPNEYREMSSERNVLREKCERTKGGAQQKRKQSRICASGKIYKASVSVARVTLKDTIPRTSQLCGNNVCYKIFVSIMKFDVTKAPLKSYIQILDTSHKCSTFFCQAKLHSQIIFNHLKFFGLVAQFLN